ncbi:aryl-sulfate sulfotransferase [Salinigranum halophilum]|jgi:hypothetical protein|uniref:aryl-sulfate sulfotransferase n=1 Tax=Salinigranum halophilum TaxID=2565931 RepID=UPI00115E1510|nr:aryl-sulfate sulfotransferase [Salinigranum halophilum]
MRLSRGVTLAIVGLVVLSSTLVVSAATAPSRSVTAAQSGLVGTGPATQATDGQATAPTTGGPHVLVGSQGGGTNWQKQGSVYRLDDQEVVWKINDRDSYFDATTMANGNVVAGFMHNGYRTGCDPYEPPCTKTGYRVLDPSNGSTPEVVSEYSFPIRGPTHSEVHDVEPMGDGRFVFADMEYERIAIVADGEVTWEWNAKESGFYDAPPDVTRRDWLHINDVDYLGDERFLVSVRNANQLLVVERGEGVVEVINEDTGGSDSSCTKGGQLADFDDDGDVRCGNPDVMNHQHNPQWLGDGRVLVADSENDRVVELHRTESGSWEEAWTLEEAGGLVLQWPRDADRLENGNTLVTDSLNRRVFEVTPGGEVVWSYATPLIPYEADPIPLGEVAGDPASSAQTTNGTDTSASTDGTGDGPATSAAAAPTQQPASSGGLSAADIPGLSLLLVGIKAVVPRLPIWFGEFQLLVTLLSLGLVGVGLVDHRRD